MPALDFSHYVDKLVAYNNYGHVLVVTNGGGTPRLWQGDSWQPLSTAGYTSVHVNDMNDQDQVVGWGLSQSTGSQVALLWGADGQLYDLNNLVDGHPPGFGLYEALRVNNTGDILCAQGSLPYLLRRTPASTFNLSIDHVEVSQVIQDEHNYVSLIYNRPMLVRAWLKVDGTPPPTPTGVTGRLDVYTNGSSTPMQFKSEPPHPKPQAGLGWVHNKLTEKLEDTLKFAVTISKTEHVDKMVVDVNPQLQQGNPQSRQFEETGYNDNITGPLYLHFECIRPPNIFYAIADVRGHEFSPEAKRQIQEEAHFLFAHLHPVPSYTYVFRHSLQLDFWNGWPGWPDFYTKQEEVYKEFKAKWPQLDALVVWVPNPLTWGIFNQNETLGQTSQDPPLSWIYFEPGAYQATFAHELGHRIRGEGEAPFVVTANVGVQVRPLVTIADATAYKTTLIPPGKREMMMEGTSNQNTWTESSWYNDLITKTLPILGCNQPVVAATGAIAPVIEVQGTFNLESSSLDSVTVEQLAQGTLGPFQPTGRLAIRAFTDPTTSVADFEQRFGQEYSHPGPFLSFSINTPAIAGPSNQPIRRLDILDAVTGATLFTRSRSLHAPRLAITSPAPGTNFVKSLTAQWKATDDDGDALTFSVAYSSDESRIPFPVATHITDTSLHFDLTDLPGSPSDAAVLFVSASDGFNTTTEQVTGLTIGTDKPPVVRILSPPPNAVVDEGVSVIFFANADDIEDGPIPDDGVTWTWQTPSQSGTLHGQQVIAYNLPPGPVSITASVADSAGHSTSQTVSIQVNPRPEFCPGDLYCDKKVDENETRFLKDCLAGPGVVPHPTTGTPTLCLQIFDHDHDGDVDLSDAAEFQKSFTGP
ncbi:MAG: hypothetical protein HY040_23960 [Planctomycetes bacterium]|nr:hypothetical protein [Planctomycetota bacterium]